MRIADLLLQTFDHEIKVTHRFLQGFPEGKAEFKPHEKSMAMGRLAVHVARLPQLILTMLTTPFLDFSAMERPALDFESRARLLADFDTLAAEARKALAGATDEQLNQHWPLKWGEKILVDEPRSLLFYSLFLNHMVHHRAQLGVYLRLNDLPVPAIYGPSADDSMGLQ